MGKNVLDNIKEIKESEEAKKAVEAEVKETEKAVEAEVKETEKTVEAEVKETEETVEAEVETASKESEKKESTKKDKKEKKEKKAKEFTYADYNKIHNDDDIAGDNRKSVARWIITFLIELILVVGLIAAIIVVKARNKWGLADITDLSEQDLMINAGANKDMDNYTNIALFGLDSRDKSMGIGHQSDAMLVISINNTTKEVKVISVYRDMLLDIPGQNGTAKAGSAYAFGGPLLAIQMLNSNLDLNISEFITANWEGFTRAVDALGGVTVHIEEDEIEMINLCISDQITTNNMASNGVYETGYVTLNGVQATAYARIRSTGQGDITRTERQREVLLALMTKVKSADAATIDKTLDMFFPYIKTSITEDDMISIMKDVMSYKIDSTVGYPFSYEYYEDEVKGSCLSPENHIQNVTALHEYLFGTKAYKPTDKVQKISKKLSDETGVGDRGPVVVHPVFVSDDSDE